MLRSRTRALAGAALAGALLAPFASPVGAEAGTSVRPTPRSAQAIDDAVAWLATQQIADGGFDDSFPGFETPDAILALAAAGQTTSTWSETEALAAVQAVTTDDGADPLDGLDDWIDSVQGGTDDVAKAQQAAKVIALVTVPLGLDATDVDPSNDTATAVDLVAALDGAAGDGSYPALAFNGRLFTAWSLAALGETVPAPLLSAIDAAQQANGSFSYTGDPAGTGFDPDTTAAAVIALTLAGRDLDPVVSKALVAIGISQQWNGEWAGEFDDGNPNSTAMVALAFATLGSLPSKGWCQIHEAESRLQGVRFRSPIRAITDRQVADGHISGPSDSWGVSTFATAQGIQALAAEQQIWPYGAGDECDVETIAGPARAVQGLYVDLLVRVGDQPGIDYWSGEIESGRLTRAFFAKRFTGTPEYGYRVVTRLVRTYLGRAATLEEQQVGAPEVVAGRRLELAAAILGDDEYYDATAPTFPSGPATDDTWIAAVYPATTGRAASAGDVTYVKAQLEAGRTRQQIARQLLGSTEGRGVMVRDIYRQLLRRNPSAADRAYWGDLLRGGTSPERLVTLIAGSTEYAQNAGAL